MVLLICLCLFSFSLFADGSARVLKLIGSATFGNKPLTATSNLQGNGEISVHEKSYLKILLINSNTEIAFGSNTVSKIDLNQAPEKQELNLVKGLARWITGTKKGVGIRTQNAIMGVRGTDFLTTYNPALGETEVICFDGQIKMVNLLNPVDSKLISKNQWGGIGGRFGKDLSDILTLSPELIMGFDQTLAK